MEIAEIFQQAFKYHQNNRIKEAKAGYEKVLAIEPDHPSALHLSGLIAFDAGDIQTALDRVGRSVALAANERQWLLNYGKVLTAAGKPKEAIIVHQRVQGMAPDCVEAKTALADLYGTIGEHKNALLALFRLLSDNPDDAGAAEKYAATLALLGHKTAAAEFSSAFPVSCQSSNVNKIRVEG
ncbi:MAG: tetratricopeptide repeat protein [Thermodesulfobacteriota bacterium]|nr:tetratricopeptide repeat protein [Thermodesulfobacteriota bacterium]